MALETVYGKVLEAAFDNLAFQNSHMEDKEQKFQVLNNKDLLNLDVKCTFQWVVAEAWEDFG